MSPDIASASSEIGLDVVGSFAWEVFHVRHPKLVADVSAALPYRRSQRQALDDLVTESTAGLVAPPEEHVHDSQQWWEWDREVFGRPWAEAPFLWVESWFYRRLLESVDYFQPGPWRGVDPFGPFKDTELASTSVDAEFAALDDSVTLPNRQQRDGLLRSSLWGNQADLGFRVTAPGPTPAGHTVSGQEVLVDDSSRFWANLESMAGGTVCLLADNAGPELISDLILLDHLLSTDLASRVVVYVKPQPYYVSDATTADLLAAVHRIRGAPGAQAARIGARLHEALGRGSMDIQTHPFLCAPLAFSEMPQDLAGHLSEAAMTIIKGDLNYRRLVQDRHWSVSTSFADLVAYFPSPVAALRTLKSEVAVGLTANVVAAMNAKDTTWRTNGRHAVIQTHSPV
jgi:hypothetical protein